MQHANPMSAPDNKNYKFPVSDLLEAVGGVPRDSSTESIWQSGISKSEKFNHTQFNIESVYDVLIVGGGITGLTSALLLQKAGKKCVLAEAHSIGYGTTGGTTAHLNTILDNPYNQIEKDFGQEGAELVAEATQEAIDLVYKNIKDHNIECDFEYLSGYLYAESDEQGDELEKIYEASIRAGISARITSDIPIPIPFKKAIVFDGQAQLHPLKYIYGLAEVFLKNGGIILENTFIRNLESENNIHVARSDLFSIKAQNIIYATHIPPGINLLHFRCAPYRSYAVGFKISDHIYPQVLTYDMQNPYHYFRTQMIDDEKYLIVGGADHKTGHGDPDESFKKLEDYVKKIYGSISIKYKWSAQYYEPADGLPYIGKLPGFNKGIFTASGFSGNGITLGSIAGKILASLIKGEENKFADLFDPGRIKPVAGFTEFVKENTDVAYRFIADRLSVTEVDSLQELELDSGAVVEYKDKKLAVYKDLAGELHILNPVCTHAKCIVNWNNAEKSWDCPCHGARYDINGAVLTGPASKSLQKIDINKE